MGLARRLAHEHVDAVHRLVGHLLERCGEQFDAELDGFVTAIFETFDAFRGKSPNSSQATDEDRLDDPLGRNFLIAQSALLMMFFNEADRSFAADPAVSIRSLLDQTRDRLSRNLETFFPPAWPSHR